MMMSLVSQIFRNLSYNIHVSANSRYMNIVA